MVKNIVIALLVGVLGVSLLFNAEHFLKVAKLEREKAESEKVACVLVKAVVTMAASSEEAKKAFRKVLAEEARAEQERVK